ncbi:MAG: sulfite exporter TauE/SafE family protein [bacterium]
MESLVQSISSALESRPLWAPAAALLGGMLTAANPCVIASVPLLLAFLAAQGTGRESRGRRIASVLLFTLGLAFTFTLFGLAAVGIGRAATALGDLWKLPAAIICLLVALHLFGLLEINIPLPERVKRASAGWLGALLLGIAFGFISAPCATPVLAVILAIIAGGAVDASGAGTAFYGFVLLLFYSIGHCVLVIIAGLSMEIASRLVGDSRLAAANLWLKRVAGTVFAAAGIWLIFGN